ncbi:hypothetical protein [Psychrilyobacter atlanticus]|uniref:hypothetical protein n=1 Tax=Psychrilyobacter atlanticus TaxID=271091 RepID=UPI000410962E|nr:hypothetical protein [Psychrilyobacter atlanticus]
MKKLKKYSEFTDGEKKNIDFNRETITNKEIFFLVMNLYKKTVPLLFILIAGLLGMAALFYFFY